MIPDYMSNYIKRLEQELAALDKQLASNPLNARANAMYKFTLTKLQNAKASQTTKQELQGS